MGGGGGWGREDLLFFVIFFLLTLLFMFFYNFVITESCFKYAASFQIVCSCLITFIT